MLNHVSLFLLKNQLYDARSERDKSFVVSYFYVYDLLLSSESIFVQPSIHKIKKVIIKTYERDFVYIGMIY